MPLDASFRQMIASKRPRSATGIRGGRTDASLNEAKMFEPVCEERRQFPPASVADEAYLDRPIDRIRANASQSSNPAMIGVGAMVARP